MQITLGRTGITTSALAMGCARLGSAMTPLDRAACVALVEQAYVLGIRHFDTASIYGQGDSERYIGEALQHHRAQVCLSSKAGQRLSPAQAVLAHLKPPLRWLAARRGGVRRGLARARQQALPRCFEPGYLERSLHASLKRLRTDHLDIFYLHSPDPEVLDDPELMASVERWRRQGLFRAFGVSCDELPLAWRASTQRGVDVVQFAAGSGDETWRLLATLESHGKRAVLRGFVGAVAGAPDAGELLSRRFADALQLPGFGGLIVGTTSAGHLRDNVAAFQRAAATQAAFTA